MKTNDQFKLNEKQSVCAGIVSFNPDITQLKKNILAIQSQVSMVLVLDNGSNNIISIKEIIADYINVFLVCNKKNQGIANALNQIFNWAENKGFSWVLTLDQDSICESNMVEILIPYIWNINAGIICPRINYFNYSTKERAAKNETDFVDACMTSGSLTSVMAWREAKGFDEWMFIDYVDNDFGMRLNLCHYKIIRVNKAVLYHNLGNAEIKKICGFKITVFNHVPFRNYYYVRNSIFFIRKYKKHINVIKYIIILIYWEMKKLFLEKNKGSILSSLFQGFIAGFIKKIN